MRLERKFDSATGSKVIAVIVLWNHDMKVGENPERGNSHNLTKVARIFVVVYIPNFSGWFANMRTILELSLDSLEQTVNPDIGRVTLISNACSTEVEKILLHRRSELFDQIVINRINLGKIDGLLSAARGALENVIVVSDCDVLYRTGWLEEVLRVFCTFPEAGSVSPMASPRQYTRETATTILGSYLKSELSVTKRMSSDDFYGLTAGAKNPEAQLRYLNGQVTVDRGDYCAGVGNGHQCIAFRRELMSQLPTEPCLSLLEPDSDRRYLDRPPDFHGYWKLSTPRSYAFHIGNQHADWMVKMVRNSGLVVSETPNMNLPLPRLRRSWAGYFPYSLRKLLARVVHSFYLRRVLNRELGDATAPWTAEKTKISEK